MILADSNVLLRVLQRQHPTHLESWTAVRILQARKEIVLAPQNIVELWVVATRPKEQNGLGIPPTRAAIYLARLNRTFPVLLETPGIHQEWQRLVLEYRVSGKKAMTRASSLRCVSSAFRASLRSTSPIFDAMRELTFGIRAISSKAKWHPGCLKARASRAKHTPAYRSLYA